MNELKPCPFCGGEVVPEEIEQTIDYIESVYDCMGCGMQFGYCQGFAHSASARVAVNESFENVFNRRVNDER